MPLVDQHPSGSILAVGGELKLLLLPPNSRTPVNSIVTTAAAVVVNDQILNLTATTPTLVDALVDIVFGANKVTTTDYAWVVPTLTTTAAAVVLATSISVTAAAAYTLPEGALVKFGAVVAEVTRATLVGTVATLVPVRPLSGAIATATVSVNTVAILPAAAAIANATASVPFLATLSLLGLRQVTLPSQTNLIPIRSMKSGLGNEQRPTMVDFSLQCQGWIHQRDQCYARILEPAGQQGLEVWAEYYSPRGRFKKGPAIVSNLSNEENLDNVLTYNVQVNYQGIPLQGAF